MFDWLDLLKGLGGQAEAPAPAPAQPAIPPGLLASESGGNWGAQNNVTGAGGLPGHFGRLQFGQARLADAMRAGVLPQGTTPEQFMANPQLQTAVEGWHFSDIDAQAKKLGLDRYIGQTVGGVTITQDAIRRMAHLGGIGGAARFLESGGQYNPADANGTSLRDYAALAGGSGSNIRTSTMGAAPMGLLGGPQEPDKWAKLAEKAPFLKGLADPDKRARILMAMQGMTMNPNQALIASAQAGIDQRAEERKANETFQWLAGRPGGQQFAEAMQAGMPPMAALQAYMASQQPQAAPAPMEINGQLVNPATGQVIGDYRTPDAGFTMLSPEEVQKAGLPPGSYQRGADGRITEVGGGGININTGGGSDAQIFTALNESATAARAAATGLAGLQEARTALQSGIISGAGADTRLGLQKLGALLGVADPSVIANTETFRAAIAPQVAAMMKATVGSTQISNADREFAEKAAGGSISLDEATMARLLDIMQRAGEAVIAGHNEKLDRVYPPGSPEYERERALFGIQAPGGQQAAAGTMQQTQMAPGQPPQQWPTAGNVALMSEADLLALAAKGVENMPPELLAAIQQRALQLKAASGQ